MDEEKRSRSPQTAGEPPAGEYGVAERAEQASQERVEVVGSDGSVIDVVSRAEMRAGNLRHRCTYVAVLVGEPPVAPSAQPSTSSIRRDRFDPATELVVHQRAPWKDTNPSYWDIAFGGVCDLGEAWQPAAERELREEAGISGAELTELGAVVYDDDQTSVVGRAYVTWWPGELLCPDGEVVAVDRVPLAELQSWLASRDVCADSVAALVPLLCP